MTARIPESADVVKWQRDTTNGRIPRNLLDEVGMFDIDLGATGLMYPPAAVAFKAMVADAKDDGVTLSARRFYRTIEDQNEKWAAYVARGKTPPVVAAPGTSNHGEALALDFMIDSFASAAYKWLAQHGAKYRFDNNDAPSEPWHWTYRGGYEGDDMTPEEKERLKAVERFVEAVVNELKANGDAAAGARVGKATKKVEAGDGPFAVPAHVHTVTGKAE
jgi:hypothetical protein